MYEYNITIDRIARCNVSVKAKSLEDAIQKAYDMEMDDSVPHEWHDVQYVDSCGGKNHWVNGYVQECWRHKTKGLVSYTTVLCEYKRDTRELHLKPGVTFSKTPRGYESLGRFLLTTDNCLYQVCPKCKRHYIQKDTSKEFPRKMHDELCRHCGGKQG